MHWRMSHCAEPAAVALADRHYSRVTVGSNQFMPPGRKVVFLTPSCDAVWGTSWPYPQYVNRIYPDAWLCTIFRNESPTLSSLMVLSAVAATRWVFGEPPSDGMVTMIDDAKTRHKRDPGRCYRKAGFRHVGFTKKGLYMLQLLPSAMPPPLPPLFAQTRLAVA